MKKIINLAVIFVLSLTMINNINARVIGAPAGAPTPTPVASTPIPTPIPKTKEEIANFLKTLDPEQTEAAKAVFTQKSTADRLKKKREEAADLSDPKKTQQRLERVNKEIAKLEKQEEKAKETIKELAKNPETTSVTKALLQTLGIIAGTAAITYGMWRYYSSPTTSTTPSTGTSEGFVSKLFSGSSSSTPTTTTVPTPTVTTPATTADGGGWGSWLWDTGKGEAANYIRSTAYTLIGAGMGILTNWYNNPATTPAEKESVKQDLQDRVDNPNTPAGDRDKAQRTLNGIEELELKLGTFD
jgi:hypothetical protein